MNMQKWCWKVAVSLCGLVVGHAALAADGCVITSGGSDPAIADFTGSFNSRIDISSLAVGAVIATAARSAIPAPLNSNCPGASGTTVVSGIVTGSAILTGSAGPNNTLQTKVPGVGIRITGSNGGGNSYTKFWPTSASSKAGTGPAFVTVDFVKISSATTGSDDLAGADVQLAKGDNQLVTLQITIPDIKFIRGSATTCTPTVVPGNTITLPKVSVSALSANGQKAGWTSFSIRLDNCKTSGVQSNAVNVRTFFDGPRVNATTGNLDVTGPANVQLQLSNGDGSVINLAGVKGSQNVATTQIRAGTATLPYAVSYFATGKAGAGAVSSTVNFTMEFP